MKAILVCGARPNIMKIAPLLRAIKEHDSKKQTCSVTPLLVHTGQHYDYNMSKIFFQDLEIPDPDIYLGIGGGTQGEQTGKIIIEFEKIVNKERPNLVVVVGDVNSTLAAALASAKLHIPVAHVEAGLRSFDRQMPEEINRILTDSISDYLFTPSRDGNENLRKEGINTKKIFFVGNVMVDSLLYARTKAEQSKILQSLDLEKKKYALLTLHRPSNVDDEKNLSTIIEALIVISSYIPIVFPVHPRTKSNIMKFGLNKFMPEDNRIIIIEPLGYIDFLALQMKAKFVVTDSGGIQEETTVLDVPCITLRSNTERPITITQGTNILVGTNKDKIQETALNIMSGNLKRGSLPELWDGRAAERIINILISI